MAKTRVGVAEIVLSLKRGNFTRAVDETKRQVRTLAGDMKAAATKTRSLSTALAGTAAAGFAAKQLFDLGAAVAETGSKFDTVFGDQSGSVQAALDSFATMAGLSRQAAQDVTATTGAIVQGMGLSGQAAADFSVDVVKLAGDLSSFNNIPIAETANAINAAVTGEREQLKRLGIVIREADVQARALANSSKSAASELTQQEKATATLQLITERAGVAVGDLARTQNSAANRARALAATLQNVREEIAVALLPIFAAIIEKVLEFIKGIQIMAAETAVVIARMKFWQEAMFGTMESTMAANDELRRMRQAAQEVKDEIIGLNVSLSGTPTGGRGSGGAQGATRTFAEVTQRAAIQGRFLGDVAVFVAQGLQRVGQGAGFAADEMERLNRETSKFNAISSGLSFLATAIPGLGFLSEPISLITSAVGVSDGFKGAFMGGNQQSLVSGGDMTMTIRVQDFSGRTVQNIRSRIANQQNLDVPVVL